MSDSKELDRSKLLGFDRNGGAMWAVAMTNAQKNGDFGVDKAAGIDKPAGMSKDGEDTVAEAADAYPLLGDTDG